jgi:hypothetical protein
LPSFDGITDSTAAHNSSEITPIRVTGQFSLVRTRIFGRHALGETLSGVRSSILVPKPLKEEDST